MTAHAIDLRIPDPERHLAATLTTAWRDFLYAPGPGFTSPLDPGIYRSSFVVVPAHGPAVRVSSLVVPAFGGDLCRLRLEPLERYRTESFGSFFEPGRTGRVYALAPDRSAGAAHAPERAEWRYEGPALAARLGRVNGLRLIRERVRGREFSWEADRGAVLAGADGDECLLLSGAELSETALFLPSPGLFRALLDPSAPPIPGVTARDLLGYREWPDDLDISVELLPL
ncbi:MAG TPA: hypothetical protein VIG07_15940 [Methylomirabilota bacterium]